MGHGDERTGQRPDLPAQSGEGSGSGGYAPPRVERVLTPDALEHEILYAGEPTAHL